MKVREVIKHLQADGWTLSRTRGSHRQFAHPTKPGLVTVPGHLSDTLAPGNTREHPQAVGRECDTIERAER